MVEPQLNYEQLQLEADRVADLYHQLTLDLFDEVIRRLKERGAASLQDNPYIWQLEKMNNMRLLNDYNIKLIAERSEIAEEQLRQVIEGEGYRIYQNTYQQLAEDLGRPGSGENRAVQERLIALANQTFREVDNLINTRLPASIRTGYQSAVTKTVAEVVAGTKTAEQALNDTLMQWAKDGFTGFRDKAGRQWKVDNYARTIIKSTTRRAYNEARMAPARELGIDTFYYSMKSSAREMCAPLQHQIVTTGQGRVEEGVRVLALSDYGWGTPGGCLGVNCGHDLTPFIPGANLLPELPEHLKNLTPEQAIQNANAEAKQRALERNIRRNKELLHVARQLGDKGLIKHYRLKGVTLNDAMKDWLDKHPHLKRDKRREVGQKIGGVDYEHALSKDEYRRLVSRYDKYINVIGVENIPETLEDLIRMKYNNRHEYDLLNDYYHSRKSNMISAFSTFDDYKLFKKRIDDEIIGQITSDGVQIKSQSKHFIERVLGTSQDPKTGRPRSGVEINLIVKTLANPVKIKMSEDVTVREYYGENIRVTVNIISGNLVQVNPTSSKKGGKK